MVFVCPSSDIRFSCFVCTVSEIMVLYNLLKISVWLQLVSSLDLQFSYGCPIVVYGILLVFVVLFSIGPVLSQYTPCIGLLCVWYWLASRCDLGQNNNYLFDTPRFCLVVPPHYRVTRGRNSDRSRVYTCYPEQGQHGQPKALEPSTDTRVVYKMFIISYMSGGGRVGSFDFMFLNIC